MKKVLGILVRLVIVLAVLFGLFVLVALRATQERPHVLTTEQVEREQGVAVVAVRPARMDFTDYLYCDGSVEAPVRAVLRAKISETVEAVHVDVGDSVRKGQLLVEFRKADLEAQIAARRAAYEEAKNNYERYKSLFDKGVVPGELVEARRTAMEAAAAALQQAESRLKFADVRAPIGDAEGEQTGRVQVEMRAVEPGEFKAIGKELLVLVDLSRLEVRASVPQSAVGLCRVGQSLEFRLEGETQWRAGTVSRISPSTLNPNRFFDVFLQVHNERRDSGWVLRPGMYAEVRIPRSTARGALGLPASAVVRAGQSEQVFVVRSAVETVQVPKRVALDSRPRGLRDRLAEFVARVRSRAGGRRGQEPPAAEQMETRQEKVWRAHLVKVTTGLRAGGYVQIAEGPLTLEDLVVDNPRDDLRDGTKVRVVETP